MGTDSGKKESFFEYPFDIEEPSAQCRSCDSIGPDPVEYTTQGGETENELSEFVIANCANCGEPLGWYMIQQTK